MSTQETAAVRAFATFVSVIGTPDGRAAFVADPEAAMQGVGSSLNELPPEVANAVRTFSEAELTTLGNFDNVVRQTELTLDIGPHTLTFL